MDGYNDIKHDEAFRQEGVEAILTLKQYCEIHDEWAAQVCKSCESARIAALEKMVREFTEACSENFTFPSLCKRAIALLQPEAGKEVGR